MRLTDEQLDEVRAFYEQGKRRALWLRERTNHAESASEIRVYVEQAESTEHSAALFEALLAEVRELRAVVDVARGLMERMSPEYEHLAGDVEVWLKERDIDALEAALAAYDKERAQ